MVRMLVRMLRAAPQRHCEVLLTDYYCGLHLKEASTVLHAAFKMMFSV